MRRATKLLQILIVSPRRQNTETDVHYDFRPRRHYRQLIPKLSKLWQQFYCSYVISNRIDISIFIHTTHSIHSEPDAPPLAINNNANQYDFL